MNLSVSDFAAALKAEVEKSEDHGSVEGEIGEQDR